MLVVKALQQSYGKSRTLWGVDLSLHKGSCLTLIGRNGVGKSTLLQCVMGMLPVDAGSITFDGRDLLDVPVEQRARHRIGYVPQGRMIFPSMTVEENLKTGLGVLPSKSRRLPEEVFVLFPVLKMMLKRLGGDLSGGQQQQLAIARALVLDPELLILDEPTEGIQPSIVEQIGDVILLLNQTRQMTILLVEQKLSFVRRVASEFAIMNKGAIVSQGKSSELSDDLIRQYLCV